MKENKKVHFPKKVWKRITKFEIKQESLRGDNGTEKKKIDLSIQFLIN